MFQVCNKDLLLHVNSYNTLQKPRHRGLGGKYITHYRMYIPNNANFRVCNRLCGGIDKFVKNCAFSGIRLTYVWVG